MNNGSEIFLPSLVDDENPPSVIVQAALVLPGVSDEAQAIEELSKIVPVKVSGKGTHREMTLATVAITAQGKIHEQLRKKPENAFCSFCPLIDAICPQTQLRMRKS